MTVADLIAKLQGLQGDADLRCVMVDATIHAADGEIGCRCEVFDIVIEHGIAFVVADGYRFDLVKLSFHDAPENAPAVKPS